MSEFRLKNLILTDNLKKMLDKRYANYKLGKVKSISAAQSKKEIQQLLATAASNKVNFL